MRYRAAFFDFGGTLYSYRPFRARFDHLLLETARAHGVEGDGDTRRLRRTYATALATVAGAYMSRPGYLHRDLFGDTGEAYLRALGAEPRAGMREDFYRGHTEAARPLIAPRAGASEVLRRLRAAGLHLGIVSNIDDDQFEALWQACGLGALVDATTTSEEARSCKPDERIYRVALEKAGRRSSEAIFIGDSLQQDVAGASALGMTTVLIAERELDPEQAERCDHVISDLRELLPIVGL